MSDPGRKAFSTQVEESVTPASKKTTGQKIKETVTNLKDSVKSHTTPSKKKSATQQVADKVQTKKSLV